MVHRLVLAVVFLTAGVFAPVPVLHVPLSTTAAVASAAAASRVLSESRAAMKAPSHLPLLFETNAGQFPREVRFAARTNGATLFLGNDAVMVMAPRPGITSPVVRVRPLGSRPHVRPTALDSQPTRINVFSGADGSVRDVRTFGRVRYADIYAGIDLDFHGANGRLEYDFIVDAGADPSSIAVGFDGATSVSVDASGELLVRAGAGMLRQRTPIAYQTVGGVRRPVDVHYVTSGTTARFVVGKYDRRRTLVIDPVILTSTYLGGSGDELDVKVAYGPDALYVAGTTSSADFPTVNPLFPDNGAEDVFVAKFTPSGATLLSVTYLGGAGVDTAGGIAVDAAGRVYVVGTTASANFPTTNAVQPSFGGGSTDAFVTAFNANLSSLLFSTYMGGAGPDDARDAYAGQPGGVFLAGSGGGAATSGAMSAGPGFVAQLTSAGALVYRAHLLAIPNAVAVDPAGSAYVGGATTNAGLGTPGAFQVSPGPTNCGNRIMFLQCDDGFVTKVLPGGTAVGYSTYLRQTGGEAVLAVDRVHDIAVNAAGEVFVTGLTSSPSFPTTPGAYQPGCVPSGACWQGTAFVTHFNASGSALVASTYLGPSVGVEYGGFAIALGADGSVHVGGNTGAANFPVVGSSTPGAASVIEPDGFVSTFTPDLSTLTYSSFVGGLLDDRVTSVAVSPGGAIAIGGTTQSDDFPLVRPVQDGPPAGSEAFVQVLTERQVISLDQPTAGGTLPAATFTVSGYAVDVAALSGTGVDAVHVYAYSLSNPALPAVFVGAATYGSARPALTATFGPQFTNSGFTLGPVSLPVDRYLLAVFAHSTVSGTFGPPLTREFTAVSGLTVEIEQPADGPVPQTFVVRGHALDLNSATGTGVDAVHVYAYPNPGSGTAPVFIGAEYGDSRPDLAASLGARFEHSGFSVSATLPAGRYEIVAHARSSTTGQFGAFDLAEVTVPASAAQLHFDSPAGPDVFPGFVVSGWAADTGAPTGTGIDAVHVWAYPNPGSGAAAIFLGSTTSSQPRDDVAALLGSRYRMTGFAVTTSPLSPGTYLVAAFGRSTVTGRFDAVVTRTLTVRDYQQLVHITAPQPGTNLGEFMLEGYAFGTPGAEIDGIHVWVYRNFGSGAAPEFVNLAPYPTPSEAASAHYGAGLANTRFNLYLYLGPGTHLVAAYAHSSLGYVVDTVLVTVPSSRPAFRIEQPVGGQAVPSPFVLTGWALDQGAPSGNGVRSVDVYAYPNPGSGQQVVGLGTVHLDQARHDVATVYGQQFLNSGLSAPLSLPPGVYDLAVFPHSDVAAAPVGPAVIRVTVVP